MPKLDQPQPTDIDHNKRASVQWPTIFFVVAAGLIYFLRASQYILQPQLYAEDGAVWLADGYNRGLHSLVLPYNGFFHLPERLVGYLVAQLPLSLAPFLLNALAGLLFLLVAYYLFSPRTKILSNDYQRLFVLVSLGLIANVDEFFFNFANSVFFLGLIGVLIFVATEPKNIYAQIAEKFLFAISCFTLIFAWFYLPILLIEKFIYKRKVGFYLTLAIIGAASQAMSYLHNHIARNSIPLPALLSKFTLLEIYNQIIVPVVSFGRHDILPENLARTELAIITLAVILALSATIYVFRISAHPVRYLLFFLIAWTAASFTSPLVGPSVTEPVKFMATAVFGDRYFIFGIIGLGIVLAISTNQILPNQWRYPILIGLGLFGLTVAWHSQSLFIDKGFQDYRSEYTSGVQHLKQGAPEVIIPINPPSWQIVLHQKNQSPRGKPTGYDQRKDRIDFMRSSSWQNQRGILAKSNKP